MVGPGQVQVGRDLGRGEGFVQVVAVFAGGAYRRLFWGSIEPNGNHSQFQPRQISMTALAICSTCSAGKTGSPKRAGWGKKLEHMLPGMFSQRRQFVEK